MIRPTHLISGLATVAVAAAAAVGVSAVTSGGSNTAGAATTCQGLASNTSTVDAQHEVSRNWSGYVVQGKSGQHYSDVSGSWTVPSVSARTGYGFSADWVGIGGATQNSKALEQTGTTSEVVNGKAKYSAWYEIVPAAESSFNLTVHAGDHMYAKVTVNGGKVTMSLSDQTTGHSVSKTQHPSQTDTSSAEWIAEAPSAVLPSGRDQVLPLADFKKVTFKNACATADGHGGSISDSDWSAADVQLSSSASITLPGAHAGSGSLPAVTVNLPSTGDATPSKVSKNGTKFSVSYTSGDSATGSSSRNGGPSGPPPVGFGFGGHRPTR